MCGQRALLRRGRMRANAIGTGPRAGRPRDLGDLTVGVGPIAEASADNGSILGRQGLITIIRTAAQPPSRGDRCVGDWRVRRTPFQAAYAKSRRCPVPMPWPPSCLVRPRLVRRTGQLNAYPCAVRWSRRSFHTFTIHDLYITTFPAVNVATLVTV